MSGNKINSIHVDTFLHNTELESVDLDGNSITDVHPSTFQNNSRLTHLYMSGNKINSIKADTFVHNTELEWLDLGRNSITDVHPSTFRNNRKLTHLNISGNKISSIQPDTFLHNTELENVERRKITCPCRQSNYGSSVPPARSFITIPTGLNLVYSPSNSTLHSRVCHIPSTIHREIPSPGNLQ